MRQEDTVSTEGQMLKKRRIDHEVRRFIIRDVRTKNETVVREMVVLGDETILEKEKSLECSKSVLQQCAICDKNFVSLNSLQSHFIEVHSDGHRLLEKREEVSQPCFRAIRASSQTLPSRPHVMCTRDPSSLNSTAAPTSVTDSVQPPSEASLRPERSIYPRRCPVCKQGYQSKQSYSKHLKSCGRPGISHTKCIFDGCELKFFHKIAMIKHLKDSHDVVIESDKLVFRDMDTFLKWKVDEEAHTFSKFTASSRKGGSKRQYSYYTCQFDVVYGTHKKRGLPYRKTTTRWKRGQLPNFHCPARMLLLIKDNVVNVEYFKSHNHQLTIDNIKYQQLPVSTRMFIKNTLSLGVLPRDIVAKLKENNCLHGKNVSTRYVSQMKSKMIKQGSLDVIENAMSESMLDISQCDNGIIFDSAYNTDIEEVVVKSECDIDDILTTNEMIHQDRETFVRSRDECRIKVYSNKSIKQKRSYLTASNSQAGVDVEDLARSRDECIKLLNELRGFVDNSGVDDKQIILGINKTLMELLKNIPRT